MFKSFSIALIWLFACGILTASASEKIVGTYDGIIVSGLDNAGITIFSLSKTGEISGAYEFKDGDSFETGELTDCQLSGFNLRCIWHDKFGSGDFNVIFSDDFSSFDGKWFEAVGDFQKYGLTGGEKWSGEKS